MRSNQAALFWVVAALFVLFAAVGGAQEGGAQEERGTSHDPLEGHSTGSGELEPGDRHDIDGAATAGADHVDHAAHPPYVISSMVWALVSFLVVLGTLLKFVFPLILKAMDERADQIREGLAAAEKARADAEAMMARHQDDLAKARAEAAGIIDEAKSDATQLKDAFVASAQKEAEEITARSLREIEQAKHTAIDGLQRQAAAIAVDIAGGLVEKSLNADDHKQLIQERLKRFQPFQAS